MDNPTMFDTRAYSKAGFLSMKQKAIEDNFSGGYLLLLLITEESQLS